MDCSSFEKGGFSLCQARNLADIIDFARCSLRSCPCAYFLTDNTGCYPKNSGSDGIYIGGYIPLKTFANKLTVSSFLRADKIALLKQLGSFNGSNLLSQINSINASLTDVEDQEINRQYLTFIFSELRNLVSNFNSFNITQQTLTALFYIANYNQKEVLINSKVWEYIKQGAWKAVYRYTLKPQNDGVKIPQYIDKLFQNIFSCDASTRILSDIILIMSKGNTEGNNIATYAKHILNLIRSFNVAPGATQMGLIFSGTTTTQLTSTLVDFANNLLTLFGNSFTQNVDNSKSDLADSLTKASSLFDQRSRASQSGGDQTSISPQTIVLFTDGNYSSTNPITIAKTLKNKGIQIIVLTLSKDPVVLNQLKLIASDDLAFSINDASDSYKLLVSLITNKKEVSKVDSGVLKLNSFLGTTTYFEVPILNKGVTVTIKSNKDVNNLSAYGSPDFPYPNESAHDFKGLINQTDQSIVLSGGVIGSRMLQSSSSSDHSLKVGVKAKQDNHQLTIQIDPNARHLQQCINSNCSECDVTGTICSACVDGYALFDVTCVSTSLDVTALFGQIVYSNDGSNFFVYRLEADPTTVAGILAPLLLCLVFAGAIFFFGLKKFEWIEIKVPNEKNVKKEDKYKQEEHDKPDTLEPNPGLQNKKEDNPESTYVPTLKPPPVDPLQKPNVENDKPKTSGPEEGKNQSPVKDKQALDVPSSQKKQKSDESQQATGNSLKKNDIQYAPKEVDKSANSSPNKSANKKELTSPEVKQLPNMEYITSPSENKSNAGASAEKQLHDDEDAARYQEQNIGLDDKGIELEVNDAYDNEQEGHGQNESHHVEGEEDEPYDEEGQEENDEQSPEKLDQHLSVQEQEEQNEAEGEPKDENNQHQGGSQGGSPSKPKFNDDEEDLDDPNI